MPKCQGCGAFVTERFAAVFGGNEDEVVVCINCGKTNGAPRRDIETDESKRRDILEEGRLTWEDRRSDQ